MTALVVMILFETSEVCHLKKLLWQGYADFKRDLWGIANRTQWSKADENFIQLFSISLKALELVSKMLLKLNLAVWCEEVLNDIDEFTLRQLACEFSVSREISHQKRITPITWKVVLKKILSSDFIKIETLVFIHNGNTGYLQNHDWEKLLQISFRTTF